MSNPEIYIEDKYGNGAFSDSASLEDIKIFMAKHLKVYQDAVAKAAEAEKRLREANSDLSKKHQFVNQLWMARGQWLTREVRKK